MTVMLQRPTPAGGQLESAGDFLAPPASSVKPAFPESGCRVVLPVLGSAGRWQVSSGVRIRRYKCRIVGVRQSCPEPLIQDDAEQNRRVFRLVHLFSEG